LIDFNKEVENRIQNISRNAELHKIANQFMLASTLPKYSYNFSWLGRPIIQYPQDIIAMQELIWFLKPDLIIETGIAHGGSLIFSASMLALIDMHEAINENKNFDPSLSKRKVLGIDVDIRPHNYNAIIEHPMHSRIAMIEGSSVSKEIIDKVYDFAKSYKKILICLDSNHTHDHVLAELEAYALLASVGSYCCVFDTLIENFPKDVYPDRPWGPGNNPKTAINEYLKNHDQFEIDHFIDNKLLISVAPGGYLKRVR
jgi:cephalosporin hydroxylase